MVVSRGWCMVVVKLLFNNASYAVHVVSEMVTKSEASEIRAGTHVSSNGSAIFLCVALLLRGKMQC